MDSLMKIGTSELTLEDIRILSRSYVAVMVFLGENKYKNSGGFILLSGWRRNRHSIFEQIIVAWKFSYFLRALRKLSRKEYLIWKAYFIYRFSLLEIYREYIQRGERFSNNAESIASRKIRRICEKLLDYLMAFEMLRLR